MTIKQFWSETTVAISIAKTAGKLNLSKEWNFLTRIPSHLAPMRSVREEFHQLFLSIWPCKINSLKSFTKGLYVVAMPLETRQSKCVKVKLVTAVISVSKSKSSLILSNVNIVGISYAEGVVSSTTSRVNASRPKTGTESPIKHLWSFKWVITQLAQIVKSSFTSTSVAIGSSASANRNSATFADKHGFQIIETISSAPDPMKWEPYLLKNRKSSRMKNVTWMNFKEKRREFQSTTIGLGLWRRSTWKISNLSYQVTTKFCPMNWITSDPFTGL